MKKKPTTKQKQNKDRRIVPMENKPDKVIIPKPTKTEVIEALVTAEIRSLLAKRETIEGQMKVLHDDIAADLRKYCAENPAKILDLLTSNVYIDQNGVTLQAVKLASREIGIDVKTIAYNKYVQEHQRIYIDPDRIRHRMRNAINCDPARVKVLSESNEIGEMLAHIHGFKQLQRDGSYNND
jgi:hypothetical protein